MKRILTLLFLTFLLQSCNETEFQNGGNFKAENNDLFYALHINSEMDSIQVFVLSAWPIRGSDENIEERQKRGIPLNGNITIKDNEIVITEFDTNFRPSEIPELKNFTIENGKIYADCKNLTEYVWGRTYDMGNCKTERIVFSRMEK